MLINCLLCGKESKQRGGGQKFCDYHCRDEYYLKKRKIISIKKICIICNKKFTTNNKLRIYCSDECVYKYRNSLEITKPLIREYFLERANFKCEKCGAENNHNLEIHHTLPIYKGGNNNIDNLIVLCRNCHKEIHRIKEC
jgi:5-methylcytosine-specific restriction endonuclease McrA